MSVREKLLHAPRYTAGGIRRLFLICACLSGLCLFSNSALGQVYPASLAKAEPAEAQATADFLPPAIHELNLAKLNRVISVRLKGVTLERALQHIAAKAQLKLSYSRALVPLLRQVSLDLEEVTVLEALHEAIRGSGVKLMLSPRGQLVVVNDPAPRRPEPIPLIEPEPQHLVSGTVTSAEDGAPLPGVNVVFRGTTTGTATDDAGKYSLDVPDPNGTLVFSFIGFETQEVPINGRSTIDVALAEDVITGEEVVVVGYGTQQKRDVTGSIASVSGEDLQDQPLPNLDNLLQGKAAGVQITQNSGSPGGAVSVLIRGATTIGAGKEPLYVVDGVPINSGMVNGINVLSDINPHNIESVSVLKDASATAIYGARASNGVILITTKKGQEGTPKVDVSVYNGWQELGNTFDDLGGRGLRDRYLVQYGLSRTQAPYGQPQHWIWADSLDPYFNNVTNWIDEVYDIGRVSSFDISIGGGGDGISYNTSVGYFDQEGILDNSKFDRYTASLKLRADVSEAIRFGTNLNYARTIKQGREAASVLLDVQRIPTIAAANGDNLPGGDLCCGRGPLGVQKVVRDRVNNRVIGSLFGEVDLLKNLTFKSSIALDFLDSELETFTPFGIGGRILRTNRSASIDTDTRSNWINENTLDYRTTFGANHFFQTLLGFSVQEETIETTFTLAEGGPSDALPTLNAQPVKTEASSLEETWGLVSYFGRLNYAYKDKYLFTGTLRRDGSSRFGAGNRWGIFPSASIGWRFSEEAFMANVSFVNDAKLRVSYGETGNQAIGNFVAQGVFSTSETYMGATAVAPEPNGLPNEALSWESTSQFDVGLDLSLFNNRLDITTDYYVKRTDGLLFNQRVPDVSGYSSILVNLGEIENKGFEFSVHSRNLTGRLQWDTDFNISFNRNKIISLPGGEDILLTPGISRRRFDSVSGILQEGQPMNTFYGYRQIGVFATTAEAEAAAMTANSATGIPFIAGDAIFEDLNGDHIINGDDRQIIGDPNPDFFGGFTNTFSYKGFDVSVFFNFAYGHDVLNNTGRVRAYPDCCANSSASAWEKQWKQEGDQTDWPRTESFDRIGNYRTSTSLFIEDGSFIRLKSITLGYTLPAHLTGKVGMRNARLYLTAQNLWTGTSYSGLDPEVVRADGIDDFAYPQSRTLTLGLKVGL